MILTKKKSLISRFNSPIRNNSLMAGLFNIGNKGVGKHSSPNSNKNINNNINNNNSNTNNNDKKRTKKIY